MFYLFVRYAKENITQSHGYDDYDAATAGMRSLVRKIRRVCDPTRWDEIKSDSTTLFDPSRRLVAEMWIVSGYDPTVGSNDGV